MTLLDNCSFHNQVDMWQRVDKNINFIFAQAIEETGKLYEKNILAKKMGLQKSNAKSQTLEKEMDVRRQKLAEAPNSIEALEEA
ncbi:hypothetical protein V6N13_109587 [Hibiscus sabdariffa]|uniref:DDE-1 domain-containing protein n=1 Tax=Hibiscus sabdariffa TaxID=183260 RepID=A0ABR2FPZ4_9ROSI